MPLCEAAVVSKVERSNVLCARATAHVNVFSCMLSRACLGFAFFYIFREKSLLFISCGECECAWVVSLTTTTDLAENDQELNQLQGGEVWSQWRGGLRPDGRQEVVAVYGMI